MQDVPWGLNLFLQKARAIRPRCMSEVEGHTHTLGVHIYTNNIILPKQKSPNGNCQPHQEESSTDPEVRVIRTSLRPLEIIGGSRTIPLCCWSSTAKFALRLPVFWTCKAFLCLLSTAIPQRLSALPQQQWSNRGRPTLPCHKSQSLQVSKY